MNENSNESSSALKPISLNKKDYPEIYGAGGNRLPEEHETALPKTEPITYDAPETKPAVIAPPQKISPSRGSPKYPKIIDGGVFIDYLLGTEEVLWSCRGSASAKSGMAAKVLPYAAVITLLGLLVTLNAISDGSLGWLFIGAPLLALGVNAASKYIRGKFDSYFAVTNERVLYICGKEFKTEYLYKIDRAEIYQTGKKTSDVRLFISDGDITLLEGLDTEHAKQICAIIKEENGRG